MSDVASSTYGYAANARRRFRDRNGVYTGRVAVHAVEYADWVQALPVPAPVCHAAAFGWLPWRLEPTAAPVSCGRCLTLTAAAAPGWGGQLALFEAAGPQAA